MKNGARCGEAAGLSYAKPEPNNSIRKGTTVFLYYLWAVAEKTLSYMPYGKNVYQAVGYLVEKNQKGTNPAFVTSFRMVRKAQETLAPGSIVLDVGTGWYHHAAFLLWLVGDYRVYLFD